MKQLFSNLLAVDAMSRVTGVGLNPRLRKALEAELHFPAKSSGPTQDVPADTLPDDVTRLPVSSAPDRKQA
ncbi:hypothetical protein [Yoonia sp. BS5-3]|uniref:Uncharacterized protein n=1 Tax=Yoonia phaeophyticola TaxID=3137369 RepID=A0ABZ2V677_9RHOB